MAELKDLNMNLMRSQSTLAEIERDTNLFSGIGKLLAAGQVLDNIQRVKHRGAVDKMTKGLEDRTEAAIDQTEATKKQTESIERMTKGFGSMEAGFGLFGQAFQLLADDVALFNQGIQDLLTLTREQFSFEKVEKKKASRRRGGDTLDAEDETITIPSPFAKEINPDIVNAMRATSMEDEILGRDGGISEGTKGALVGAALSAPLYNLTIGMGKLLLRFTGISAAVKLATPVFTTLKSGVTSVVDKLSLFAKSIPNKFSGAGKTAGKVGRTARLVSTAGAAADLDFLGFTNAQDDLELDRRRRILAGYKQLSDEDLAARKRRMGDISGDTVDTKIGAPKADKGKLLKRLARFGRLLGITAVGFAAFDAIQLARTASALEAAERAKGDELTALETDEIIRSINPSYKSIYELAPGERDEKFRGMGGVTGLNFNENLRNNLNNGGNGGGMVISDNSVKTTSSTLTNFSAAAMTINDPGDLAAVAVG